MSIPSSRNSTNPLHVMALIMIVGALYFTRAVCVPLILAVLVAFVLTPVVARLQKWKLGRVPAAFLVVALLLALVGFCGWMVGEQLVSLAEQLPQYQANVHEKLKSFHTAPGSMGYRLKTTLDSYSKEFESIGSAAPEPEQALPAAGADASVPATQRITVALTRTQPSELTALGNIMGSVLGPVATFGIVTLLGLLMLIRREDLRDRAIRLLGGGQLQVATQALDDAGARVSRYLLIQLIINASFGVGIGIGLFFIGVPYCLLWGLLAACLRFVPYLGAPLAAVAPLLLGFAATPGWTAVILTIVLFATLELSIANLVEPWLYGSSSHISPLAIVAAAIFWSWMWGPIGLLLSTPLTVCLVVMGRHVPRLRFLSILLGDEPVLSPEARFYQRLLAGDQAEAWEIAEEKLRASTLMELYDTLIIPALTLAEEDRHRNELDETRETFIFQSLRDLLVELGERPMAAPAPVDEAAPVTERAVIAAEPGISGSGSPTDTVPVGQGPKVLCMPANDEADEIAAIMLSHLLRQRGIDAEVLSHNTLAGERLSRVSVCEPGVVCVSAVPPEAIAHVRYMCKRLRMRYPTLNIIAGLWQQGGAPQDVPAVVTSDAVLTSLSAAVDRVAAMASHEVSRTDVRATTHAALVPA